MPRGHYGKQRATPHVGMQPLTTIGASIGQMSDDAANFWNHPPTAHVGAGSVLGHTPGDVEDELNELNNEVMTFDAELVEHARQANDQAPSPELQRLRAEQQHDEQIHNGWMPLRRAVDQIKAEMAAAPDPQSHLIQLRDAELALQQYMPSDRRAEVMRRMNDRAGQIIALRDQEISRRDPALSSFRALWDAFKWNWMRFHSQKVSVPAQTWPLSGTWDRTQEYRQQFNDLFKRAPFTPAMTPLDPSDRKDPSVLDGLRDMLSSLGTMGKVVVYGGLGLAGVIAVTSIVQQLRKNRDPLETYAGLARSRSR